MPTVAMTTRQPPGPLPADLQAPLQKLVYLYVREFGETDVDDLHETLDVSLLHLYPTLDSLEAKELVERRGEDVWVQAPEQTAGLP